MKAVNAGIILVSLNSFISMGKFRRINNQLLKIQEKRGHPSYGDLYSPSTCL